MRTWRPMLPAIPVHPEGPRYGASIVYLPGLWRGLVWSLLRRRPVPPPGGPVGAAFLEGISRDAVEAMRAEDPRVLSALSRRTALGAPPVMPPTLVLRGALDPIVSADDARGFAA